MRIIENVVLEWMFNNEISITGALGFFIFYFYFGIAYSQKGMKYEEKNENKSINK